MQREISRTGRTFGGSFDRARGNDVVRIYNDPKYSPPMPRMYREFCTSYVETSDDVGHLSTLQRAIFSNNDFTICRGKKKRKTSVARR